MSKRKRVYPVSFALDICRGISEEMSKIPPERWRKITKGVLRKLIADETAGEEARRTARDTLEAMEAEEAEEPGANLTPPPS